MTWTVISPPLLLQAPQASCCKGRVPSPASSSLGTPWDLWSLWPVAVLWGRECWAEPTEGLTTSLYPWTHQVDIVVLTPSTLIAWLCAVAPGERQFTGQNKSAKLEDRHSIRTGDQAFNMTSRAVCLRAESLSHALLFATPWTVACQPPLSMGFFRPRILEWVVRPSSRGSSRPRDWTCASCSFCTASEFFTAESSGKPTKSWLLTLSPGGKFL